MRAEGAEGADNDERRAVCRDGAKNIKKIATFLQKSYDFGAMSQAVWPTMASRRSPFP